MHQSHVLTHDMQIGTAQRSGNHFNIQTALAAPGEQMHQCQAVMYAEKAAAACTLHGMQLSARFAHGQGQQQSPDHGYQQA